MRRRASRDHGFLIAYLINLIFNAEWLFFALIAFVLSKTLSFPDFIWMILIGIWLGWTAIVTFALSAIISLGNKPTKPQKNANPYSAKNPYSSTQSLQTEQTEKTEKTEE